MIDFARVFLREKIALLVVYSIPSMLSAWVRALGPRRVAWATTKFELSSFRELEIRLSFSGPHKETREIRGKNWRRSTAAIVVTEAERFDPMGRPQTRLISVNREEKIFTQPFMSAVVAILRANPKVTFHWTGRNQNAAISEYFLSHGVADRCVFLGWVDPQKALPAYDIFLDTYGLSGVVATKAFCMGMPTVFFRDSKAWIEIHEERLSGSHLNRQMLSRVLVDDSSAYQASVLHLVQSQSDYVDTSKWQVETGREFLGNEMNMYESHVEILRELLVNITSECGRRCN
jgi:hypothetical protein